MEKKEEYREVENLVRKSFWNVYRPGCLEHFVLHQLRNNPDFIAELDYVMELNGKLIGQNIFMKAVIKADDGSDIPIVTMGPICITPELKRKGYGNDGTLYLRFDGNWGCEIEMWFWGDLEYDTSSRNPEEYDSY